jgi:hypothetical protein
MIPAKVHESALSKNNAPLRAHSRAVGLAACLW